VKVSDLYKYYRWLSLDVTVGAISVLYLLQISNDIKVPIAAYWALGSAIWVVYFMDHWLDAKKKVAASPRRIFYKENRRALLILAFFPAFSGLVSVFFIPKEILVSGAILVMVCWAYLSFNRLLASVYFKELCVAIVFAMACSLPVWSMGAFTQPVIVLIMLLGLLALSNLLVFAYYESEEDRQEGFHSIALLINPKTHRILVWLLLGLMITLSLSLKVEWRFSAFIVFSSFMLGLIMTLPDFFSIGERYRMLGDGIFLTAFVFALL